ncbi:MAG: TIGR01841 family phasin [Methylobacteriaceae bacterium]|nr:TIGR01841 family phasin [Methylobacteriaceae bacterium]
MAVRRPVKAPAAPAKAAAPTKAPEAPAKAPAPAKAAEKPPVVAAPAKPAAAKPAAAKPAAVKPAAAPVAAKPVEAKPAEAKPVEAKPVAKPTAAKPAAAPVIAVAALDMSSVQDNLRKAASKTIEQGRAAFERMKEASDDATHTIEASLAASSKGAAELAARALEVTKVNANATFDHLKALAGAKTLADAVSMHGQFIRAQSEAAIAQAKEFAELAKKAATDAAAPIQAQIKKAQAK